MAGPGSERSTRGRRRSRPLDDSTGKSTQKSAQGKPVGKSTQSTSRTAGKPDESKPTASRTRSTPTSGAKPSRTARTGRRAVLFGLSPTRRAAVFAIVVCALVLSVAVPLRTYLSQRSDVEVQEQRAAELRGQVQELEQRKAELSDPAQVEAEARRRLRYVKPGETPYIVQLPEGADPQKSGQPEQQPVQQQAWYQSLWDSVLGG